MGLASDGRRAIFQKMGEHTEIRLGIVTPMANEGAQAVRFVAEVLRHCAGFREALFFAVLDQATNDNSLELLRDFAQTEPRLRVIWAPENRCVVDAYVRGYREALDAGADWILEVDAGFSHQPEDTAKFFAVLTQGYDCIFGSRFMQGSKVSDASVKRYLVSRGGTILSNLLLGTRQTDMTSGFEMFSRAALQAVLEIGVQSRGHFFQTEIKAYCRNLRMVEVPIHYRSPSPRMGSAAMRDAFEQLRRLYRLRKAGQLPQARTGAPGRAGSTVPSLTGHANK
jgi:dolichol-phosphate mannosyltransferase